MYKIHGAKASIIEYLEQILVTCGFRKIRTRLPQLIWRQRRCWSVSPLPAPPKKAGLFTLRQAPRTLYKTVGKHSPHNGKSKIISRANI
jgi:hypothetical protein